jgi:hypothetical protein
MPQSLKMETVASPIPHMTGYNDIKGPNAVSYIRFSTSQKASPLLGYYTNISFNSV